MTKTLKELQSQMVEQLKRRGFYPKDDKEVLLRLGEERETSSAQKSRRHLGKQLTEDFLK